MKLIYEFFLMGVLTAVVSFIVAISILIAVHEYGHFWVARRCGIKILRFSLGFGKVLWRKVDKHGTEFVIAAIPLGGYVKMLDERSASVEPELQAQAFNNKTIGQRAAVIAAGPLANFLLAFILYWIVNVTEGVALRPVIGDVFPGSIAEQAGFEPDEEIVAINDMKVSDWSDVALTLIKVEGSDHVKVDVLGLDSQMSTTRYLDLGNWKSQATDNPFISMGFMPVSRHSEITVGEIFSGQAADKAGLMVGDQLISVNGKPLTDAHLLIRTIKLQPNKIIMLGVKRQGQIFILELVPSEKEEKGKQEGFVGFKLAIKQDALPEKYFKRFDSIESISRSGEQMWRLTTLIIKEVGRLFTGYRDLNSLAGPVTMAKGAGKSAEAGLTNYLGFLALISLNLGIINLFPLPILDGGHLLFLLKEKLTGRPLSDKAQEHFYRIGAILLIMLMGLAFFNDIAHPQG